MQYITIHTHTPMQKNNSKVRTLPHVWGPEELDLSGGKGDEMQFRHDKNINQQWKARPVAVEKANQMINSDIQRHRTQSPN